jgi:hypothetical protein
MCCKDGGVFRKCAECCFVGRWKIGGVYCVRQNVTQIGKESIVTTRVVTKAL